VATRPIEDMEAYKESLSRFVYQTGMLMRPVINAAKALPDAQKRVAYADGEDERALRAAQMAMDDKIARPILIGRPAVIAARIAKAGLRMQPGKDVEVCNPEDDPRFRQYWETYHQLMKRNGATPEVAKAAVRRSNTIIASLMVKLGDADAMICGLVGTYETHLERIHSIIGARPARTDYATLNALMTDRGTLFIADTYVNEDPTAAAAGRHRLDVGARKCSASACRPRWRSCRTRATVRPSAPRPQDARGARPVCGAPTPRSNATASCTATPRWSPTSATPTWRIRRSPARPTC
jgi:hypothetical protein